MYFEGQNKIRNRKLLFVFPKMFAIKSTCVIYTGIKMFNATKMNYFNVLKKFCSSN